MKPAIIKRSALLLALACVLALLGAPRASAANQVADIRIKAVLQDDGSADITQTWTATTDEGTEFYLACRDNGYLSITDFTVSDEQGTYEPLASWDVGADFTQKARKCGVVETGEGVELCWGISEYGTHTYTLRYTLHGLVGAYDDADGFNYRFIDEMGTFPTDVELTLTKADGTPLTDADCDIWAFGYQGQIQFVDDTNRAWTESPLEDSQNMTVMVALNKGVLHPERTEEGSFETVKERAFDGSDYEDEPLTAKDIFYAILGVVLLCAVVAAVILIARRIHKAKLARLVKQAPYFRDAPNGGNLNVTHRLGVCSKQCEESSILGAYLLRLISDGCLEPVQQALSEKNKNASLRLVRPPRNSAGYDDGLLQEGCHASPGAEGLPQGCGLRQHPQPDGPGQAGAERGPGPEALPAGLFPHPGAGASGDADLAGLYGLRPAPGHCRQGRPPAPSALPRPPAGDRPVRPAGDLGRVLQPRDVQRL